MEEPREPMRIFNEITSLKKYHQSTRITKGTIDRRMIRRYLHATKGWRSRRA